MLKLPLPLEADDDSESPLSMICCPSHAALAPDTDEVRGPVDPVPNTVPTWAPEIEGEPSFPSWLTSQSSVVPDGVDIPLMPLLPALADD